MWIRGPAGAVYGVMHDNGEPASTGVLIVPPFGWDEVESHRARRYWAIRLAEAGLPCLRFDLPGTGDSEGGPRDADLFDRWTASVGAAASWLRETRGTGRVAVIGIGPGGIIACRAVSAGAAIDDVILWGSRAHGRQAVREIRAYAGVVASKHPDDHVGHQDEDGIEVTGFLLANDTQRAWSDCDVEDMAFPGGRRLRVLLLSRDSLKTDPGLQNAFERAGASVTSVETRDYQHFAAHPESLVLRRPEATVALSISWLGEGGTDRSTDPNAVPATGTGTGTGSLHAAAGTVSRSTRAAEMQENGHLIRETILDLDVGGFRGFAIVTEPTSDERAPVAAVLLSPGAIRKIGQHRMWVELARRWAARGVVSVRFDLPGVGDTGGPSDADAQKSATVNLSTLYSPETVTAVTGVLAQLRDRGFAQKFVTVGHCSGAYLGMHASLMDASVLGCFSIDQQIFQFDEAGYQGQMLKKITAALRDGLIRRLRERGVTAHEMAQVREAVAFRLRRGHNAADQRARSPERMLNALNERGTDILLLLVQQPELGALMPDGGAGSWTARWPNLVVEELPTQDHMARALWLQKLTHERLDVGLQRLLLRVTASGVPAGLARQANGTGEAVSTPGLGVRQAS